MENEVMNYEETMDEVEANEGETEVEDSELSAGVAMLIGAGLAFATTAIVKLGKKAYAAYKAKKEEQQKPDGGEDVVIEA